MSQRQLTITIDEETYRDLHNRVGRDEISSFIEEMLRSRLLASDDVEAGYRAMAADANREREAEEWSEALLSDTLR